ncbi:hypothetical protein AB8R75_26870, partial [Klebsiella quasipneumoniae subsp. similipneumoniae]
MFRINSIMNDSRDKVRVHDFSEDSHNNYYTILTGDNASGKSSLLSKAINFFLFSNVNNNDRNPAVELECLSERNPREVAIKWSAAPDMTPQTVLYRRPVAQFSNFQPKIVS